VGAHKKTLGKIKGMQDEGKKAAGRKWETKKALGLGFRGMGAV